MIANVIAPARPEKTRARCAWTPDEQAEWMRLFEESGKGLSEFCRENGLPESTVSLWRKRLRQPTTKLGMRNWMFIGHPNAGWRSAVIYTIVGTCELLNIDPECYLTWLLPKLAAATTKTATGLLPHDYAARALH